MNGAAEALRTLLIPFISKRVDPQDVDDVLHTVFVRIQRGLASLRDSERLVPWGYQIARNTIIDHLRSAELRRHETLDLVGAASTLPDDDDSGASELVLVLGHFIAMLPDPYREALQLTELEGITQAAAAERVGLSLPGMKSRVQRGRAQLRALLEACCDIELDTRGSIIDVAPRNRPAHLPDCCSRGAASIETAVRLQDMTNKSNANSQNTESTEAATAGGCCGGPAPDGVAACCVQDAAAKAAGETGCGCGPKAASSTKRGCC